MNPTQPTAPSPSLGEPDDVLDWQALAKAENAEEVFMAFPRKTLVLCIKIFCDELERRASPTAAQGQKAEPYAWSYRRKGESSLAEPALFRRRQHHLTDEGWDETPLFASPVPDLG